LDGSAVVAAGSSANNFCFPRIFRVEKSLEPWERANFGYSSTVAHPSSLSFSGSGVRSHCEKVSSSKKKEKRNLLPSPTQLQS